MANESRATSQVAEVLAGSVSATRVTVQVAEVLAKNSLPVRITSQVIEVLANYGLPTRVSSQVIEVLAGSPAALTIADLDMVSPVQRQLWRAVPYRN